MGQWCRDGVGDNQLRSPSDLAVGTGGRLVVADSGNDRVQVFGPQPPATMRREYLGSQWMTRRPAVIEVGDDPNLPGHAEDESPYAKLPVHDYGLRVTGIITPTAPSWSNLTISRRGAVRIWRNDELLDIKARGAGHGDLGRPHRAYHRHPGDLGAAQLSLLRGCARQPRSVAAASRSGRVRGLAGPAGLQLSWTEPFTPTRYHYQLPVLLWDYPISNSTDPTPTPGPVQP